MLGDLTGQGSARSIMPNDELLWSNADLANNSLCRQKRLCVKVNPYPFKMDKRERIVIISGIPREARSSLLFVLFKSKPVIYVPLFEATQLLPSVCFRLLPITRHREDL